jgi:hypothetical protein
MPDVEVPVGDFACDVVAQEVGTGHPVVIENQLEATDHSHLGQMLTYAAGLDARAVVWIAPDFRPEHRQAIDWLNANTAEGLSFFGVEVELLQIESSPYAVHFKLVAQPNDWQKVVKSRSDGQPSQRALLYQQFFTELLTRYRQEHPSDRIANKAGLQSWLTVAGAGRSGLAYNVSFTRDAKMRVELYIDTGNAVTNKAAFDQLMAQKDCIEDELGETLSWERLDNARSSRVAVYRSGQVTDVEPLRTEHLRWGVSMVRKARQTLSPHIQRLLLTTAPGAGTGLADAPEDGSSGT